MQRLWYVAYGSNLSLTRLRCYLLGGQPEGAARRYPGCRDPSEPAAALSLTIAGGICFAGHSSVWGGGLARYEPDAPGRVAARAYLLTAEQFTDVLAQEMRQPPGIELDLSPVHTLGQHSFGPGSYETLVRVGSREGLPMLTFTSNRNSSRHLTAPTATYLRTLASGLRESHGWSARRIGAYLAAVPGAEGAWTPASIESLAAQSVPESSSRRGFASGVDGWRADNLSGTANL